MSRQITRKRIPKKKSGKNVSANKYKSGQKRQQGRRSSPPPLQVPKMNMGTIMELTCMFVHEEFDFSNVQGFDATECIFLVLSLMLINLEEMDKEYRRWKRKNG